MALPRDLKHSEAANILTGVFITFNTFIHRSTLLFFQENYVVELDVDVDVISILLLYIYISIYSWDILLEYTGTKKLNLKVRHSEATIEV